MRKFITPVIALALLGGCVSAQPQLAFSQRFPIAVDLMRQPNGDKRPEAEGHRDEAACKLTANAVRRETATALMMVASQAALPALAFNRSSDLIGQAAEDTLITCMESKGWRYVATDAEAAPLIAKARADRLAGR